MAKKKMKMATDEVPCRFCTENTFPLKVREFCDVTEQNPVKFNHAVMYDGSIYVALKEGAYNVPTSHKAIGEWYGGMCADEYIAWMNTQITGATLTANGDLVLTNSRGEDNAPLSLPFIKNFVTRANGDVVAIRMDGTEMPIHQSLHTVRYEDRVEDGVTNTYAIMNDGTEQLVHAHGMDNFVLSFTTDAEGNVFGQMRDGSTLPVLTFPTDNHVVSGIRNADNSVTLQMENGDTLTIPPTVDNYVISVEKVGANLVVKMRDGTEYTVPGIDTSISGYSLTGSELTITETNGASHTVSLTSATTHIDVSDFTITGNMLTVTESNGDTHTVTLPASAADVKATAHSYDEATGVFTTTLSDGSTITVGLPADKYIIGFQFNNLGRDGKDSFRQAAVSDSSIYSVNESYLLDTTLWKPHEIASVTQSAEVAGITDEIVLDQTITEADLTAIGLRPTDNVAFGYVLQNLYLNPLDNTAEGATLPNKGTGLIWGGSGSQAGLDGTILGLGQQLGAEDDISSAVKYIPVEIRLRDDRSIHVRYKVVEMVSSTLLEGNDIDTSGGLQWWKLHIQGFRRTVFAN